MKRKKGQTKNICIAQINYNSTNIHNHVERIKHIIDTHGSCDLIVFPELILHGHPSFEKPEGFLYRRMKIVYRSISEKLYEHITRVKARVIIGEVKRWGERYYNMATYIDEHTKQSYIKTHVHWTENFVPGRKLTHFDTALGKVGINICFDAAFSEVWKVLALKGARVIINISAVPTDFPVKYMWLRMAGAALNNQVFVIYANRPGPQFSGHSAVFNPLGECIAAAKDREIVFETEIDMGEVAKWRKKEDLYNNRRPSLYREIMNRHTETKTFKTNKIYELFQPQVKKFI